MAAHCSECGFVSREGANYCQKCGSFLAGEPSRSETTATFSLEEATSSGAERPDPDAPHAAEGSALVVRAGGGRAGESFAIVGSRMTVGRSPDSAVFLDDVTVSRHHALLVLRREGVYLDDLGSLNGTYVNRRRIESQKLRDGDDVQIGKYKLTYLER